MTVIAHSKCFPGRVAKGEISNSNVVLEGSKFNQSLESQNHKSTWMHISFYW